MRARLAVVAGSFNAAAINDEHRNIAAAMRNGCTHHKTRHLYNTRILRWCWWWWNAVCFLTVYAFASDVVSLHYAVRTRATTPVI